MEEDKEVCELYKQRALQFANIYKLFFSDDGKMIPYGRSLIYRFGSLAFWSAALYSKDSRFDKKYIKWLLYTSISEWMNYDIFDENNIGFQFIQVIDQGTVSSGTEYQLPFAVSQ